MQHPHKHNAYPHRQTLMAAGSATKIPTHFAREQKSATFAGETKSNFITMEATSNTTNRPFKNRLEQIRAANEKYGYIIINDMKAVLK